MNVEAFFRNLEEHYKGVFVLIIIAVAIVFLINWLARIFGWGRYNRRSNFYVKSNTDQIIAEFFARLINDFRHLLALIIVLIFVSLVFYAMAMTDNFEEKMKALQLVIASLGGLLGSIIGYYFGESAVRRSQSLPTTIRVTSEENTPETEQIVEAPVAKDIVANKPPEE